MSYSIKRVRDVKLDFYCRPSLTWVNGESGVWGTLDVSVGCRPQGRGKVEGNPVMVMDLSIEIVLPPNTSGANITTSAGKVLFDQEEKRIVWMLGNLRKEDIPTMKGPVYLKPGSMVPSRRAMRVRCRIFHCGESRLYAAGGKSLRTGSWESECASYEGRVQYDIDIDEATPEWNIRYSDVIRFLTMFVILTAIFNNCPESWMAPILGIDLGTTNTVAAFINERTNTVETVLQNGNPFPSCVIFKENGSEIVCPPGSLFSRKDVAFNPKRLIGRSFHDKYITSIKDKCGFPLCEMRTCSGLRLDSSIHEVGYSLPNGKKISAVDVCTKILKKVKQAAEKMAGCVIEDAVITIPVQYSWEQRQETYRAAENAGFHVLCLQYEPVMAAYDYCYTSKFTKGTLLVFDFGGGTVDSTVISVDNGVFKVMDTRGDSFLGGDDLTNDILDELLKLGRESRLLGNLVDPALRNRLKQRAESLKKSSSASKLEKLDLNDIFEVRSSAEQSRGRNVVQISINSDNVIRDVVSAVNLAVTLSYSHNIDRVLMIGGSSAFYLCREKMKKHFGEKVRSDYDPVYCVARGAARCPREFNAVNSTVQFKNTVVHGIGILQKGGSPFYLINSGRLLPLEGEQELVLVKADSLLRTVIVEEMEDNGYKELSPLVISLNQQYPENSRFILKFVLKDDLLLYYSVCDSDRRVVSQMKRLILRWTV